MSEKIAKERLHELNALGVSGGAIYGADRRELSKDEVEIMKKDHEHSHIMEEKKLDLKKAKSESEWKSCCFSFNRHFVEFISKLILLGMILCIGTAGIFFDNEHFNVYVNMIVLIIGIITPQPRYKAEPPLREA